MHLFPDSFLSDNVSAIVGLGIEENTKAYIKELRGIASNLIMKFSSREKGVRTESFNHIPIAFLDGYVEYFWKKNKIGSFFSLAKQLQELGSSSYSLAVESVTVLIGKKKYRLSLRT